MRLYPCSLFIIAAARHYICFLQFNISDEYLCDVEKEEPQLTLPVISTGWLDLNDPMDRKIAIVNVLGLVQLSG
jgi:hypothetical protein